MYPFTSVESVVNQKIKRLQEAELAASKSAFYNLDGLAYKSAEALDIKGKRPSSKVGLFSEKDESRNEKRFI